MAVSDAEALAYQEGASEGEIAAFETAHLCAREPAPNEDAQFNDLFLVRLRGYPRRVPVVAVIGVDRPGGLALDEVWVFWPDRPFTRHDRHAPFDKTALAMLDQRSNRPMAA